MFMGFHCAGILIVYLAWARVCFSKNESTSVRVGSVARIFMLLYVEENVQVE